MSRSALPHPSSASVSVVPDVVPTKLIVEKLKPRLLDLADAAKYCGLSESRMREYVTSGKLKSVALPHPHKSGKDTRKILILLSELDAFIERYSNA